MLVLIVVVVTVLFMLSAATGLDKGIKILSNLNVAIAAVLAIAALLIGPTSLILTTFVKGLGLYAQNVATDLFSIKEYMNNEWYGWWTIFYWAWWIAWAPFVGTFIARISRGRTLREFVVGVLLAPSMASFLWFSIFGSMGINAGLDVATEAIKSTPTAFFVVMDTYPMGSIISFIAVCLLCTFFVTSADSATFVLGMMTSNGDLNPTTKTKLIWGSIQSLLALALMLFTANGLGMLQTISIVAAFPFAFVMIFGMISIYIGLKSEDAALDAEALMKKAQ
jgi:glycine betaine transporter